MYENFVGTWETVRNRELSVLERCPHGEVRLYLKFKKFIFAAIFIRTAYGHKLLMKKWSCFIAVDM